MKISKKLKNTVIILGVLLLLTGIITRFLSIKFANEKGFNPTTNTTDTECTKALESKRQDLISQTTLLLSLFVFAFVSRINTGKVSMNKLVFALLFVIGCVTIHIVLQTRVQQNFGTSCNIEKGYVQYGSLNELDAGLTVASNSCAILGTLVLLL
tara:strand:- start:63 stop:527 length:465 start_codon:yes stop_codon:yes gene_type:complete